MGEQKAQYSAMGDPSDVTQTNTFTQGLMDLFQGNLSNLSGGFIGGQTQLGAMQGATPFAQGIANTIISPYGVSAQETGDILANNAVRDVANQFSGMNALNSGAALSAMVRGAALPRAQTIQNIAGMQSQLGGGLMGQALGGQMGMTGQLSGILGGYGAPEWWQPTMVQTSAYQPSFGRTLMGAAAGVAPMIAGGLARGALGGA